MDFPEDLKYTEDHEWVRIEGDTAYIGITDFAQKELGDIVFVEVETVGETLDAGDAFGTVEAVKTVSDLYMPVSGEIKAFNEMLEDSPEQVNESPYDKGWMVKVALKDKAEVEVLMDAKAYRKMIRA